MALSKTTRIFNTEDSATFESASSLRVKTPLSERKEVIHAYRRDTTHWMVTVLMTPFSAEGFNASVTPRAVRPVSEAVRGDLRG